MPHQARKKPETRSNVIRFPHSQFEPSDPQLADEQSIGMILGHKPGLLVEYGPGSFRIVLPDATWWLIKQEAA